MDLAFVSEPPTYQKAEKSGTSSSSQQQPQLTHKISDITQSRESSLSRATTSNVYLGSYARDLARNRASLPGSLDNEAPRGSIAPSARSSMSHSQLQHLLAGSGR